LGCVTFLFWFGFESDLQEIDLNELQLLEDLGTGNFGVRIALLHCLTFIFYIFHLIVK